MKQKIFTVSQVAKSLGVSSARVRQICGKKALGTIIGHDRLLTADEVREIKATPRRKKIAKRG